MNYHIVLGNILETNAEAIVNASDKYLTGGGGIDRVIHRAAGSQLKTYLYGKHLESVGDALISPGFNLAAKYIIHTVGPRCYGNGATEAKKAELKKCYMNCLDVAKANGIKSIAFPCISTGVYKFPKAEAAVIATNAVKEWFSKENYDIEVFFTCFGMEDYKHYMMCK